ncbi:MAG: hypothetical protein DRJ05_10145 [Bacteroidetes bacterium]|nr:MAG: hypothetical protein DRJ05_10145 [Bacteroidota bacterium]
METIVIQSKSKSNAALIIELVKKIGDQAKLLTKEQTEDIALGLMMKNIRTGENVSRDEIMQKLRQ